MRLVFGLGCDGPTCPDFPGAAEGALNSAVVGPAGLIGALELELGLTAPREAEAVRIAAYAARLRAALAGDPTLFFAGIVRARSLGDCARASGAARRIAGCRLERERRRRAPS